MDCQAPSLGSQMRQHFSNLLVARGLFIPSSFLLLVVMPGATSILLLLVRNKAPCYILVARSYYSGYRCEEDSEFAKRGRLFVL